jgi:hypothetical protein
MKEFSKEKIEQFVKESKTISEVLNKIGYAKSGAAFKQFIKYSKENNIDISDLLLPKKGTFNGIPRAKTIEEVATQNSSFSRKDLKKKIIKLGLKKYECEECGHPPLWRGKEIHLILDHINGINNDNRLENLRFLCPMCNATLDTHGGKNNRIYKDCQECGKKYFGVNEKYCSMNCSSKYIARLNKKERKTNRPKFAQLMLEIEETSYVAVGKKYGVSDNTIRKWVKYYQKYGDDLDI